MTIRYYEKALSEFLEGIDYYSEIDTALGEYFYQDILHAIESIKHFPRLGKKHHEYTHLRVLNCQRFPYLLIYHYETDEHILYIVAVAHQKREPDYWRKRL